ncbi:MAG: dTDP-4-dehydrorhamnose 3,5-epimerase [Candidatus Binatia bacterium]
MIFTETPLQGAFIVDIEGREDIRGFFARTFCREEFAKLGLKADLAQCSISLNKHKGTLRGMHFQLAPREEVKIVRCTRGAIYDVIIDLRPQSPTYCRWSAVELTEDNHRALYVPPGFAHGFQTLSMISEVFYQMTEFYAPELARGVRWDDPVFGIKWPIINPILSEKDANFAAFKP